MWGDRPALAKANATTNAPRVTYIDRIPVPWWGESLIIETRTRGDRPPGARTPHEIAGHKPGGRRQPPVGDLGTPPEESVMSLMDIGAIAGALVFLALLGTLVYKMSLRH